MSVRVNKASFSIREKLSELERPIGLKGSELMRAETAQEARDFVSAGRKNIIINGAMQVAQRGTSTSSFGATSGKFGASDRWQHFTIGTTNALWTVSQDTDAPDGYRYSLKYDCTTADASPAGSARHQIQQKIEAYNTNHLGYGTSVAKDLVLSFWVKATLPGVNYGWFYDSPNDVFFPFRYYINVSNTWEKKVITIPGNTANTLSGTNSTSLICAFALYMGSNYTSNNFDNPGVWQDWNSTNYGKFKDSTNHASSTNNNFWITGIQLEVGKNATEFEHRSYGEELALCERYFQKYSLGPLMWASPRSPQGTYTDLTYGVFKYRAPMRTAPNVGFIGSNFAGVRYNGSGYSSNSIALSINTGTGYTTMEYAGADSTVIRIQWGFDWTINDLVNVVVTSNDSAMTLSAEL